MAMTDQTHTAFAGARLLATGPLSAVALAVKAASDLYDRVVRK